MGWLVYSCTFSGCSEHRVKYHVKDMLSRGKALSTRSACSLLPILRREVEFSSLSNLGTASHCLSLIPAGPCLLSQNRKFSDSENVVTYILVIFGLCCDDH